VRSFKLGGVTALGLGCLVLAACGSGAGAHTTTGAVQHACRIITPPDVVHAVGPILGTPNETDDPASGPSECIYQLAAGGGAEQLNFFIGAGQKAKNAVEADLGAVKTQNTTVQAIGGLGTAATREDATFGADTTACLLAVADGNITMLAEIIPFEAAAGTPIEGNCDQKIQRIAKIALGRI
jgi:hypothetical protein